VIHHVSLPARDPAHVAQVLSENAVMLELMTREMARDYMAAAPRAGR